MAKTRLLHKKFSHEHRGRNTRSRHFTPQGILLRADVACGSRSHPLLGEEAKEPDGWGPPRNVFEKSPGGNGWAPGSASPYFVRNHPANQRTNLVSSVMFFAFPMGFSWF